MHASIRWLSICLSLGLMWTLICPIASARPVSGIVTNAISRTPLANVVVRILQTGDSTQTDNAGKYVFPNVPDGSYTMLFGRSTYQPLIKANVAVTANVSAGDDNSTEPKAFGLGQNYPNPFNSSTVIEYTLPTSSHVILTLYNVLGQEIRQLADADQSAGFKRVDWDGKDGSGRSAASGIYFYRLQAAQRRGDKVELISIKKMLLLK